ncbi:hypothetical protein D9M73_234690 [compost metagenome]
MPCSGVKVPGFRPDSSHRPSSKALRLIAARSESNSAQPSSSASSQSTLRNKARYSP